MVDRFRLLGRYKIPAFRYGQRVQCEVRGEVLIVGLTAGPIAWPIGKKGRAKSLVVFKGLASAIRRESINAVAHHWGVTGQTVTKWRRRLGIAGRMTKGTLKLKEGYGETDWFKAAQRKAWSKARDPERRAKIAAAKLGQPRPAKVRAALLRSHKGKPLPVDVRRKMSRTHQKRGTRPPWIGPPWTPAEDEAVRTMEPAAAAKLIARSLQAVYVRRNRLGLPDGRKRQ